MNNNQAVLLALLTPAERDLVLSLKPATAQERAALRALVARVEEMRGAR